MLSLKSKINLGASSLIMGSFFVVKTFEVFGVIRPCYSMAVFDYVCVLLFFPFFASFVKDFLDSRDEIHRQTLIEVSQKNTYLEHAAKILRHDMHSGINTYIPRGISSLERRLTPEVISQLKLASPLKLLREGLAHTQKVYRGVYEFTNLVKEGAKLHKEEHDLNDVLTHYFSTTAYKDQVAIDVLPKLNISEPLFCTAIDNLVRNGLKYNDSEFKMVAITMVDDNHLAVVDNGRGMTQDEFEKYSKPYARRTDQKEKGSGLGLDICIAILREHGFEVTCEKQEEGTMIKVKIR